MGTRTRTQHETFAGEDAHEQAIAWVKDGQKLGWQFVNRNVRTNALGEEEVTVYLEFVGQQQDQTALADYVPEQHEADPDPNSYTDWEQWVVDTVGELQKQVAFLLRTVEELSVRPKAVQGEIVFEPGLTPAPRPWNRT